MFHICKRRRSEASSPRSTLGADSLIRLNVGGRKFLVARSTLCGLAGSPMLSAMFTTTFNPASLDEEGNYFIDREGETFPYILDFLRNGRVTALPHSKPMLEKLCCDADYFGMDGLKKQILKAMRMVRFELLVFGKPIGCEDEVCRCGLSNRIFTDLDDAPFTSYAPHGYKPKPPAPPFDPKPNLTFLIDWDPDPEEIDEMYAKACRIQKVIRNKLNPGHKIVNDGNLDVFRFIAGCPAMLLKVSQSNERLKKAMQDAPHHSEVGLVGQVHTFQAFTYLGPDALRHEDDDVESLDLHRSMWLRLELREVAQS